MNETANPRTDVSVYCAYCGQEETERDAQGVRVCTNPECPFGEKPDTTDTTDTTADHVRQITLANQSLIVQRDNLQRELERIRQERNDLHRRVEQLERLHHESQARDADRQARMRVVCDRMFKALDQSRNQLDMIDMLLAPHRRLAGIVAHHRVDLMRLWQPMADDDVSEATSEEAGP